VRLLDVGCGRGGFGYALRRLRTDVGEIWGIEPHPDAANEAREQFDHVITGSYPADIPAGERFDVIVFNDVLEHMQDPAGVLRKTSSILTPDGTLVASIPNVRYWLVVRDLVLRGLWTYTETGPLDRSHLRFFTRSSAFDLFVSTGYAVARVEHGYEIGRRSLRDRRYLLLPRDLRTLQYLFVAKRDTRDARSGNSDT
jgi:SAM-dependent methyltransferase